MAKETLDAIMKAAAEEFLTKGFKDASLRSITHKAQVTTGALYGYYKSKDELFAALVEEPAVFFKNAYYKSLKKFDELSILEKSTSLDNVAAQFMFEMLDYLFDHKVAFRLLLTKAAGTEYENYVHDLVVAEKKATHKYIQATQKQGVVINSLNPKLEHILISGMFNSYFEIIIHDYTKKEALAFVPLINNFYVAGWSKLLSLKKLDDSFSERR